MKIRILLPTLLIFLTVSAQAATFVVNSTGDGADANTADNLCQAATLGECTLRAAIQQANQTAGPDAINFNIAPFDGLVKTIAPASPLPNITQTATINGYTIGGTAAGATYVFTASYKSREFTARIVSASEDLNDLNFVAFPAVGTVGGI